MSSMELFRIRKRNPEKHFYTLNRCSGVMGKYAAGELRPPTSGWWTFYLNVELWSGISLDVTDLQLIYVWKIMKWVLKIVRYKQAEDNYAKIKYKSLL